MFWKLFHAYLSESSFTQVQRFLKSNAWRQTMEKLKKLGSHTPGSPARCTGVRGWLFCSQLSPQKSEDLGVWRSNPHFNTVCGNWGSSTAEERCYLLLSQILKVLCAELCRDNFNELWKPVREFFFPLRFITSQKLEMLGVYIPST